MFHSIYTRKQHQQNLSAQQPLFVPSWPPTYTGQKALSGLTDCLQNWRLEIDGLIEQPLSFSFEELMAYPQESQDRRLISAAGWTYRSIWQGIPFHALLERIKPLPEAKYLRQENRTGQTETIAIEHLLANGALLCVKEKGQQLSPLYGGPLQLMVFDRYHYKGLGQLTHLTFTDTDAPGYWESLGYSHEGTIQPGDYYAFDLRELRPADGNEIQSY